ncbi:MAG: hypothetical protein PHX05_00025 [Acidobacteriota bacterium]|nr:hypothetical protein [Acidobacteriota bacterium]
MPGQRQVGADPDLPATLGPRSGKVHRRRRMMPRTPDRTIPRITGRRRH